MVDEVTITDYRFGRIAIGRTTYGEDVLILPPRVLSPWWRKEGHRLDTDDLGDVMRYIPSTLVVGTGAHGLMRVPPETLTVLRARGIDVEVLATADAVRRFNELLRHGTRVAAAFHLTC